MDRTCIVVADGGTARFFGVEEIDSPRKSARLVERSALTHPDLKELGQSVTGRARTETNTNREAGPVHPMAAQRDRHRMELDRRFGAEIARQAAAITKDWKDGTVLLVAEPRLLGLMRQAVRDALRSGIELKELAKDYVKLTVGEIEGRLALNSLVRWPTKDGKAR